MKTKILSVSDIENFMIYSQAIKERFKDIQFVISCGDLPHYYLEYILCSLNVPLYYVNGNHTQVEAGGISGIRSQTEGGINLHLQSLRDKTGILLAGIEGSHLYNYGLHQYTQTQMWQFVWWLVPALMANKVKHQRYLDVLVTHAPPWKVHDDTDLSHQGIKAFRWLIKVFQPKYHFHGHIHAYNQEVPTRTVVSHTLVINAFDYKEVEIEV